MGYAYERRKTDQEGGTVAQRSDLWSPQCVGGPDCRLKSSRISLDTDTFQVFVGEKEVNLTITELKLLDYLLKNSGTTLSRDDIFEDLWDQSYPATVRTVDTHIQRLRRKLGMAGYLIRTVRGVGYRLEN